MTTTLQEIENAIASGAVVVVGRRACPYSVHAANMAPANAFVFMVDDYKLIAFLQMRYRHPTVPLCFENGVLQGGSEFFD